MSEHQSGHGRSAEPPTPESQQQRRERAAIAAQACETCRSRKSKCDEQRPKCSVCRRLTIECRYRDPQPTKKDKTLVHILQSLQRLETKVESITGYGSEQGSASNMPSFDLKTNLSPQSQFTQRSSVTSSSERDKRRVIEEPYCRDEPPKAYQHLTAPHKLLLWPTIQVTLLNSGIRSALDLQDVALDGTSWFIQQELVKHPKTLPFDVGLPVYPVVKVRSYESQPRVVFPGLTYEMMQQYASQYFNTYNVLYPLLDREDFVNRVLPVVSKEGFGDSDVTSIIALLVFALGIVALEGTFGDPISIENGFRSGIRGGTAERPPGLEIFNEVRKRLGFVMSQCGLENIQILLLTAIYYEACSRHLDFWRLTVSASMACQVLVKCEPIDWSSHRGDLVKRAYWNCNMFEKWYNFDLDLPQTGITDHEDHIPLPTFIGPYNTEDTLNDEQSHLQHYFLAVITLRRLITRVHSAIYDGKYAPVPPHRKLANADQHPASTSGAETTQDYSGAPVRVIKELARQLESWRSLLPTTLQWNDGEVCAYPRYDITRDPLHVQGHRLFSSSSPLFAADQGAVPIIHTFNLDIVTAHLRTRFYYTRFMIYRPFVYEALHFPEQMSAEDVECCTLCLKSCLQWPVCMAPPKNKKRLVPFLFAWTQNFLGILLIFRMTTENVVLKHIRDTQVDKGKLEESAQLMLEWIRDMKQVDGIAEWGWNILEPLYSM